MSMMAKNFLIEEYPLAGRKDLQTVLTNFCVIRTMVGQ
jgi:hypothetical protein